MMLMKQWNTNWVLSGHFILLNHLTYFVVNQIFYVPQTTMETDLEIAKAPILELVEKRVEQISLIYRFRDFSL